MSESEWHLRESVIHATNEPQILLTMTVFGFQPTGQRKIWSKIRHKIPIGFNRNFKKEQYHCERCGTIFFQPMCGGHISDEDGSWCEGNVIKEIK